MRTYNKEEDYDYRLIRAIKEMLRLDPDFDLSGFNDGNELFNWLWDNRSEFVKLIFDDMLKFDDEDDWLEEIKKGGV
jgi:hypothetical protein